MKYLIKNLDDKYNNIIITKLKKEGIIIKLQDYGEVELLKIINSQAETEMLINTLLKKWNMELICGQKNILCEKIKKIVEEIVFSEKLPLITFSIYLSKKTGYHYTYLSNIFSEMEGITITQYIIIQKIERVKAMLTIEKLSLEKVVILMKYSSTGHLSRQFKKITGMSPTTFKNKSL